jgi:hypothetical protein
VSFATDDSFSKYRRSFQKPKKNKGRRRAVKNRGPGKSDKKEGFKRQKGRTQVTKRKGSSDKKEGLK